MIVFVDVLEFGDCAYKDDSHSTSTTTTEYYSNEAQVGRVGECRKQGEKVGAISSCHRLCRVITINTLNIYIAHLAHVYFTRGERRQSARFCALADTLAMVWEVTVHASTNLSMHCFIQRSCLLSMRCPGLGRQRVKHTSSMPLAIAEIRSAADRCDS